MDDLQLKYINFLMLLHCFSFNTVASPDLMISAIPNNTDIAAGSNITLNCCATVSTHIHDGFSMNFTWLGPDGKRLTYTNLSVNSSSLTCSEISLTVQSTGVYTCSANVYSSFPSAFILDSTPTIKQQSIVVYSGKPQVLILFAQVCMVDC